MFYCCYVDAQHRAIPHGQGENEHRVYSIVGGKLGFVRLNYGNQHSNCYKYNNPCSIIVGTESECKHNTQQEPCSKVHSCKVATILSPIGPILVAALETINEDVQSMPPHACTPHAATKTPLNHCIGYNSRRNKEMRFETFFELLCRDFLYYHTLCVRIITTYRVYQLYNTLAGSL